MGTPSFLFIEGHRMQRRALDFDDGVAMVVTDLHGAGAVYYRLRDRFLDLLARGEVNRLIICGDLIHGYGESVDDDSLEMLLDVIRLQGDLGTECVVLLLGNHEMPHIYGVTLKKGNQEFTPRFEEALARLDRQDGAMYHRADVISFLADLPFFARTRAGVLLTHAGATPVLDSQFKVLRLLDFDHQVILKRASRHLEGVDRAQLRRQLAETDGRPYDELAAYYLGVSGMHDPRYDDLLRSMFVGQNDPAYDLLWEVLFSQNEIGMHLKGYNLIVKIFLHNISEVSRYPQRVLVAGHIAVDGGYDLVGNQQLRLASYAHAEPKKSGRYLLLDCAKPVRKAADLVPALRSVFED